MAYIYRYLFPFMWLAWCAYWWLAVRGFKPVERRESMGSRLLHVVPLTITFWLLWAERVPGEILNARLFMPTPWTFWASALATALGLLFSVWARVHLGGNWSATVTAKQDHELVTTGPYAWVRHPIYTGLLLAFVGSAAARGQWRGIVAVLIAWVALWRKLQIEERFMLELFQDQYRAYRRRVPALIPLLRPMRKET